MSPQELIPLAHQDYELAAIAERSRFAPVMDVHFAMQRRAAVKEAFSSLMAEGQDFGKIPGTGNKPTLLQPGAQKLDNLFGLVPRFPMDLMRVEEDWTGVNHAGEPFFRYMVVCQVMRGEFVMGEAIGECNSWEVKYRYRKTERKCPMCGAEAITFTKKNSFWCAKFKNGCNANFNKDDVRITGQEVGRKPNPDIFDQINTLLKMAQKRAHVAATINATSASEFCTQDLEDHEEHTESAATSGEAMADQRSGSGSPRGESHASGGPPTRSIPEELTLIVQRIRDNSTGAVAEAFKMLEHELLKQYDRVDKQPEGQRIYNDRVMELRRLHPRGGTPAQAYIDCMLDLWDAAEDARAIADARAHVEANAQTAEAFVANDDDVPSIIGGSK